MIEVSAVELIGLATALNPDSRFVSITGRWNARYNHWDGRCNVFCDEPEATLVLRDVEGPVTLEIVTMGWSGILQLSDGTRSRTFDAYSAKHALATISLLGDRSRDVTLKLLATRNVASRANQLWLRRIFLTKRPHWIHREQRVTPSIDFVHATEGEFLTLTHDNVISKNIRVSGAWSPHQVDLFRNLLRPGNVAIDVGANIGHHTVVMAKLVGPTGKVYAFEPQRRVFQLLQANLALNQCDHVEAFELALGERAGVGVMRPQSYDDGENPWNVGSLSLGTSVTLSNSPTAHTVKVCALDELLPDIEVAFLKCDAQGFDYHVLRGAAAIIERCHPAILTEVAPELSAGCGVDYLNIHSLLQDLGYTVRDPTTLQEYTSPRVWTGAQGEEWDLLAFHLDSPSLA